MRRVLLAIVSTVASLVMLLSFKTHTATSTTTAAPPAVVSTPATTSPTTATSTTSTRTVTGAAIDTRYGPVQVRITVANGKITSAAAIEYPQNDPRDQQINSYAVPALNSEAVQAGSASIDMVSGATFTSAGYIQSLQSALDKV
jgi:uncharacterized protein with FMN-binding domain